MKKKCEIKKKNENKNEFSETRRDAIESISILFNKNFKNEIIFEKKKKTKNTLNL